DRRRARKVVEDGLLPLLEMPPDDVLRRAVDQIPVVHARRVIEVQAVDRSALFLAPARVGLHEEQQREQPRLVIRREQERATAGELERCVLLGQLAQDRDTDSEEAIPFAILTRTGFEV